MEQVVDEVGVDWAPPLTTHVRHLTRALKLRHWSKGPLVWMGHKSEKLTLGPKGRRSEGSVDWTDQWSG